MCLPLHGELNPRDQDAAVARYQQRKVVVATNVAETSLTIDANLAPAHELLGVIAANAGQNALAVERLERARQLGLQTESIRLNLASALRALGRMEEAERVLNDSN